MAPTDPFLSGRRAVSPLSGVPRLAPRVETEKSMGRMLLPHIMGEGAEPDEPTQKAYRKASYDSEVRSLVSACRAKQGALLRLAGRQHLLHSAVIGAALMGCTPAEWLATHLRTLTAEIEAATREHAVAEARDLARRARQRPLTDEVRRRTVSYEAMIPKIQQKICLAIDARGAGPTQATIQGWHDEVERMLREHAAMKAWHADPNRGAAALAGIPWAQAWVTRFSDLMVEDTYAKH